MKITPLIDHLKTKIPQLNNRIASVVEFKQLIESDARLITPALYVMIGDKTGEPVRPQRQTYIQPTAQNIYIFLVLDNTRNQLGGIAQDRIEEFENYLTSYVVNYWYTPKFAYPIEFLASGLAFMDSARYIHRFEYVLRGQIDFTDTEQEEYPDLTSLFTDINISQAEDSDYPNAQTINNF